MEETKKETCVFCGVELDKLNRNNPYPVKEDGWCCNRCDREIVMPARGIHWNAQDEADGLFRSIVYAVQRMNLDELWEVWNFVTRRGA